MKKSLILALIFAVSLTPFARAHESISNRNQFNPYLIHNEQWEELENYLEIYLHNSKRFGILSTNKDARELGERLVTAVHYQIMEIADIKGELSFSESSLYYLKTNILPKLNLIKIGLYVMDIGRKLGARLAITIAITELLENASFVYAAINPKYAFLIPLAVFHVYDATTYGFVFGIPAAYRKLKTINRFGNGIEGMNRYYNFLVQQRNVLPIDWSVVIDVQQISFDGKHFSDLAILKKHVFEKYLPEKLKPYVTPRRAAQRATSNAISINDLEKITKMLGIKLYILTGLNQIDPLYSRLLIQSILENPKGLDLILEKIKTPKSIYAKPFDGSMIFNSESLQDLTKFKETPDILAQRLIWFLNDSFQELRESEKTTWSEHKALRLLTHTSLRKLKIISETKFLPSNSHDGYEKLLQLLIDIKTQLGQFNLSNRCSLILKSLTEPLL